MGRKEIGGLAVVGVVAIVVIGAVLFFATGIGSVRGESTYSGEVVDLENQKGMIVQTSQVHMKTDATSSSSETFCVHPDNREQMDTLRQAASSGQQITVTYERPLYVSPMECEGGTSIVKNISTE